MRSGYLLRKLQQSEARSDALCACGHRNGGHREYGSTWTIVDGELIEARHPKYEPGLFACSECGCEVRP